MQLARTESGPAALAATVAKAEHYILNARSKNTVQAYRSDWRHFTAWCAGQGIAALPAEPKTVALYLAELADAKKVSTLTRRLAAISKAHQAAGFESPCAMRHAALSEVLAGIRRTKGIAPQGKAALLTADVRRLLQKPDAATGLAGSAREQSRRLWLQPIRDARWVLVDLVGKGSRIRMEVPDLVRWIFIYEGIRYSMYNPQVSCFVIPSIVLNRATGFLVRTANIELSVSD